MIFLEIIKSWKESLITFKPENLKLLFLASLKRFLTSFPISVKIYILIVVVISLLLALNNVYLSLLALLIMYVCYPSLLIMAVRPSLEIKDFTYFISYEKWLLVILINALIFFGPITYFLSWVNGSSLLLVAEGLPSFMQAIPLTFRIIIESILLISLLFFFDSNGTIIDFFKSLLKGMKAIIWYFPVFAFIGMHMIIFNLLYYINDMAGYSGMSQYIFLDLFLYLFTLIVMGLLKFFVFSIFAIFYTKIKHSNFSLFY